MTDGEIERVLRGLRDVEGAPGLEARVLARVAGEASDLDLKKGERLGAGRGWGGSGIPAVRAWGVGRDGAPGGFLGGWGLAGAVLAAVVVMGGSWLGLRVHSGAVVAGVLLAAPSGRDTGGLPGQAGYGADFAAGQREVPPANAGKDEAHSLVACSPVRQLRPGKTGQVAGEGGRVESGGMRGAVVSVPVPPMPLSEQERLLLELARAHDPAEMALLDGEARTARETVETARFESFFRPVVRERPVLFVEFKASDGLPVGLIQKN